MTPDEELKILRGQRQRVLDYLDRVESEPPCPPCEKYIRMDVRRFLTVAPSDFDLPGAPVIMGGAG